MYIYERQEWPRFSWDTLRISGPLTAACYSQGVLTGHMRALGFPLQQEAVLQTLTDDVVKSSEIEGERLEEAEVRSSIARRLGIDIGALTAADRNVEGVVEMTLDAIRHYEQPLPILPCVTYSS